VRHGVAGVCAMMHERDRMAQRADKWWRSVWLVQMCMQPKGVCDDKPKALTGKEMCALLKSGQAKPKQT